MDALNTKTLDELKVELTQRHRDLLKSGERFELTTTQAPGVVRARLAIVGGADGAVTELEAVVEAKVSKLKGDDALGLALDALDLTLGEYLEQGRSERLNAALEQRELQGRIVGVRGRVRHPALDAEADRLLGEVSEDDWK